MSISKKQIVIFITAFLVVFGFFVVSNLVMAQGAPEVEERKAELEAELIELEREIAEKEAVLATQKTKSQTLQNEVNTLKTKISQSKLKIKVHNIEIKKLSGEITQKEETINTLTAKMEREKESLGQLIRKRNEIDQLSIVHLILSTESLSNFYIDIDSFASIKAAVKDSVDEIKDTRAVTGVEKEKLTEKKNSETDAKAELERQKRAVEKNEKERKKLLDASKDKEKGYKAIIAEREKKAAEIRSALFALRDTAAIPFGVALEYAQLASAKTGVRPAFILAILTQESNLGQNIGSCYLRDTKTGDGVGKNTGRFIKRIMKPTRDVKPFLRVTKALGLDPFNTPVSCPWVIGFGGAMGPSQFIPSTWEMFQSKIAAAVGVAFPSPWNPKHAITATAIYVGELGANKGGFTAEREAACRYYSGRGCMDPKVKNLFYGNAVMEHARNIQENMIDPLQNI